MKRSLPPCRLSIYCGGQETNPPLCSVIGLTFLLALKHQLSPIFLNMKLQCVQNIMSHHKISSCAGVVHDAEKPKSKLIIGALHAGDRENGMILEARGNWQIWISSPTPFYKQKEIVHVAAKERRRLR